MLQLFKLSKSYGAQTILDQVSFIVNRADRVGLVGSNGCGKTTLLRIIAGLEQPDSGRVNLDLSTTIGYLPQGLEITSDLAVFEYIRSGINGLDAARQQLERLALQLSQAQADASKQIIDAYGNALARFEALGGYAVEHRISAILAGLGLAQVDPNAPLEKLSGGQRTRIGLARILVAEPTLLLLDEPTNHLDIQALEWLEQFLSGFSGAVIVVSHDAIFLDRTVLRILELDEGTHHVTEYVGNYRDYAAAKERERGKQWALWKDQQAKIQRIEADIALTKAQARRTEQGTNNDRLRRYAKKVASKAKARESRLRRYLESEERVEKPELKWRMKLEFGEMTRGGQSVITLDDLGHAFGDRWLFRHANLTLRHGERIALIGPNGSGKTTLLRILAGELSPLEGSVHIGANVRLGYMPQEQETLDANARPLEIIRQISPKSETEARHLLHYFLFEDDDVFVPVNKLSYGERARLLLAQLVVAGANCLLLDEPINHLDIPSREQFEAALYEFPGTVLIAVHDRAFINRFARGIWSLQSGTLRFFIDREEMGRANSVVE